MTVDHDGHPWDTEERSALARHCPGRSPLLALARDVDRTARLVVMRRYSEYLGRDEFTCLVATGDHLWTGCMTGHRSEETAARHLRGPVAKAWRGRVTAPEIVVVNGGRSVECRWETSHGYVSHRDSPVQAPDGATLIDYGPA